MYEAHNNTQNCFESWNAAGLQKIFFHIYFFKYTIRALRGKASEREKDKNAFQWDDSTTKLGLAAIA